MVYNLDGDFPNLHLHNQTQRTQPAEDHTTRPAAVAATPSMTVTLDCEEMKTEFMKLIQTEVQTQIQKWMADIQADVVNIGVEIDTMQEGIRDRIGAVVRESIQASFNQQAQQTSYQQQQYLQQTAHQPPAHTLHSTQNNYSSQALAMNYCTLHPIITRLWSQQAPLTTQQCKHPLIQTRWQHPIMLNKKPLKAPVPWRQVPNNHER
jgi:hypothetical protein